MPASLMYFCSGKPMQFCSGVDTSICSSVMALTHEMKAVVLARISSRSLPTLSVMGRKPLRRCVSNSLRHT